MLYQVPGKVLVNLVFLLAIYAPVSWSQSGWVITERISDPGTNEISETTLYIRDNKIKSVEGEHQFIFDLSSWKLTLLIPSINGYWNGSPGEFLEYTAEIALEYLAEEIGDADEFNRPYLEALYEDLKMEISHGTAGATFMGELPVDIIMTGEQDRLLGYLVNRYILYVDGIRTEELWLAPDISLADQYDYEKFRTFTDEMTWGHIFQDYRSSEQYIHLIKQGLPLKTVEFGENGMTSLTEAVSVDYTEIPDITFSVPREFKPVSLAESGLGLF